MNHHSVMTSSLRIKIFKIDKFGDISYDIDFNTKIDIFRGVIFFIITNVIPSDRRKPPADTKCPPAAQRKHARRACILLKFLPLTPKMAEL